MSQLTFRDDDVKNMRLFLEFVRDRAKFKLDLEEAIQLTKYIQFMQDHIRKVNAHVMELLQVVEPDQSAKTESAPASPAQASSENK